MQGRICRAAVLLPCAWSIRTGRRRWGYVGFRSVSEVVPLPPVPEKRRAVSRRGVVYITHRFKTRILNNLYNKAIPDIARPVIYNRQGDRVRQTG